MDAIPTLAVEGFTTNKTVIMTKLYEYFMSSDYSQSNTFFGDIASLKYILAEAADSAALDSMVTEALYKMYDRYFDTVVVDTIVTDDSNMIRVDVNIVATDYDTKVYKLNQTIRVTDNKIVDYNTEQEEFYAQ